MSDLPPAQARRVSDSHLRRSMRAFARQWSNWLTLGVLVFGLLMIVIPKVYLPHDPTSVNPALRLKPPSWSFGRGSYLLGTDVLGRDLFSRMIFATRWTYLVSGSAALISTVFGTLAGLAAGFYGGITDAIVSRLIDMQLAFPVILLAISILAVAGPRLANMILVLALVDWARYARVVRAATFTVREQDFIDAAYLIGASSNRIILYHILPNILSSILVLTSFSAARLVLTESALSFLGLGVTPPATTWGAMLGEGRDYIYQAWWLTALPGAMVALTVLSINILGDGLRDALDPQSEAH